MNGTAGASIMLLLLLTAGPAAAAEGAEPGGEAGPAAESLLETEDGQAIEGEDQDFDAAWEEPVVPEGIDPADVYPLERCLELAMRNNRQVKAAEIEVEVAGFQADEAAWAGFPRITVRALAGPSPGSDRPPEGSLGEFIDWDPEWRFDGILFRTDLSFVLPLYTFGKLSSVRDMGERGRELKTEMARSRRVAVAVDVKKAWYTLEFVMNLIDRLEELEKFLHQAEESLEKLLQEGSSQVSEIDRHKLEVVAAELAVRMGDARRSQRVLEHGLRLLTGLPEEAPFVIPVERGAPRDTAVGTFEDLHQRQQRERPEYRMLDLGRKLHEGQLELQEGYFYPDLFLAGFLSWSYSSSAWDSSNPYLSDRYNFLDAGVGVGLEYRFDIPLSLARVRQKRAELRRFDEERLLALDGLRLELRKELLELEDLIEEIRVNTSGQKAGRSWLIAASMNYNIGLSSTTDMAEALAAYAKTSFYFLQSVYNYKTARAELECSLGHSH